MLPEETRLGQKFLISMTLYLDTRPAGKSDCLEKSVHYGEVSAFATASSALFLVSSLSDAIVKLSPFTCLILSIKSM